MWECGLKPRIVMREYANYASLPMWECGLKRLVLYGEHHRILVTPHVGVWIETNA